MCVVLDMLVVGVVRLLLAMMLTAIIGIQPNERLNDAVLSTHCPVKTDVVGDKLTDVLYYCVSKSFML